MEITYRTNKLKKACTDATAARRQYGDRMAGLIHQRIDEITAALDAGMMARFKIGRCHLLQGIRARQYAVDLIHPYRLVFTVEKGTIQIAKIEEIVDYH